MGGARKFLAWGLQLCASSFWVAAVVAYDEYETGDVLQLLAACSWTVSNLAALPEVLASAPGASAPVPSPSA